MMVPQLYTFPKNPKIVYLKVVNSMVCKLCLNKVTKDGGGSFNFMLGQALEIFSIVKR